MSIRDLLTIIFYHRRLWSLLLAGLLLIGLLATFLIPPSYTARARLLTLSGGVYDVQSGATNLRQDSSFIAVDVEEQILESAELHRATVRRMAGSGLTGEAFENLVADFEKHLKVSKLETGNVVEVTYRNRDAQQAAAALKTLLAVYFEQRATVFTSGRVAFLTSELDKVRTQLDAANSQIEAYEKEHGVVDVAAQIGGAVTLDDQLHQRLAESESASSEARRSVEVLKLNADHVPQQIELSRDNSEAARTVGVMESELFNLEAKRADLASRYMATSPFVTQADAQVAQLQAAIERQKKQLTEVTRTGYNTYKDQVNTQLATAQATLAGTEARRVVVERQVAESARHLKDLVSINDTITRLTSQRDLLANTARDYAEQLEHARIQQNQTEASGTTNVRVIESPSVPRSRNNPQILFLAATIVASVLITAVVIVVVSSMREVFLTPEEAERSLHLPVLCDVARRNAPGQSARRAFGRLIAAADSVPTAGLGKTILLLTSQDEGRINLVSQGLVESLEPRAPGRIALVHMDEDMDAPTDNTSLLLRPLTRDAEIRIGMTMTRSRLTSLFHEMRSAYDYVVITAPPAYLWFESLELSTLADLSVMVVAAEQTRRPVAETVLQQASYIGGNVDGLVMTGRKYYIPAWLYRMALGRGTDA